MKPGRKPCVWGAHALSESKSGLGLEKLYDVVVAPETWPDVLHEIAHSANGVGACLAAGAGSKTLIAQPVSPGLVEPIDDFINSGWYKRDLRGLRAWPLFREGRLELVEHDVSTEAERRSSAYHNEWLKPWDLPWWGALGFSLQDQYYGLVVLRNTQQGALTHADMRPLTRLRPHLVRVLKLIDTFASNRAEIILDTMDLIEKPAFALDARGRVTRLNAKAEHLVRTDFRLSHGALRATRAENDKGLQQLIATAVAPGFSFAQTPAHWTAIRRLDRKPLIVTALPIIGGLSDIMTGIRAVLIVTDLDGTKLPPEEKLRLVFGLTSAEARTALRLATGEDVGHAADALGITAGTVRNHLKAIFGKTGTHRQGDLLRLIERMSSF